MLRIANWREQGRQHTWAGGRDKFRRTGRGGVGGHREREAGRARQGGRDRRGRDPLDPLEGRKQAAGRLCQAEGPEAAYKQQAATREEEQAAGAAKQAGRQDVGKQRQAGGRRQDEDRHNREADSKGSRAAGRRQSRTGRR